MKVRRFPVGIFAACAAMALLAIACAVNPATGKRQLSLIGEGDEAALGKQYDQQTMQTMSLYGTPEMQAYVQQIGKKLAAT